MGNIYADYTLSRNGFRYIEALLYNHKKADYKIKEIEAELKRVRDTLNDIEPSITASLDGMPKGSSVSSETENIVIRRVDSCQIKYLQGRIDEILRHRVAIDTAIEYLSSMEKTFIALKYDKELTAKECIRVLCVSKTKYYNMRQEIVKKIAGYLEVY